MLAIIISILFPALPLMSHVTLNKLFKSEFQLSLNEIIEPDQWFSNFSECQNHLDGMLKHCYLGPTLRVSDSIALKWDPIIYISN